MDVKDGLNIGDRPMLTRHHSKSRLGKLSSILMKLINLLKRMIELKNWMQKHKLL